MSLELASSAGEQRPLFSGKVFREDDLAHERTLIGEVPVHLTDRPLFNTRFFREEDARHEQSLVAEVFSCMNSRTHIPDDPNVTEYAIAHTLKAAPVLEPLKYISPRMRPDLLHPVVQGCLDQQEITLEEAQEIRHAIRQGKANQMMFDLAVSTAIGLTIESAAAAYVVANQDKLGPLLAGFLAGYIKLSGPFSSPYFAARGMWEMHMIEKSDKTREQKDRARKYIKWGVASNFFPVFSYLTVPLMNAPRTGRLCEAMIMTGTRPLKPLVPVVQKAYAMYKDKVL